MQRPLLMPPLLGPLDKRLRKQKERKSENMEEQWSIKKYWTSL
jgi:hypothetical protein